MDWEREGLLDGLDDEARGARRRLLDRLHADGVPVDELRAAVAGDRLVLLPLERALLPGPRYTLDEVTGRAGVDRPMAEARLRALGVSVPEDAGEAAFGDAEVELLRRGAAFVDAGIPLDRSVMHAMSGAIARIAEPARWLFARSYLREGDAEDELAARFAEMAERLTPLLAADLEYLLRHHLRDLTRHDALSLEERRSGRLPEAVDVAVGFADIVGFTRLGQEVPDVELTGIAEQLEDLADAAVRRPARVVKTIGDAVMVVAADPVPVLDAMLDLVAAADARDGFPPLRAGVAHGPAVPRAGDWFGAVVNLASRLCGRARPEAVLTTNGMRDALGEAAAAYAFSEAGLKHFKGFDRPVPTLRVRRAPAG